MSYLCKEWTSKIPNYKAKLWNFKLFNNHSNRSELKSDS